MSDAGAASRTDDLGVVDAIRVPGLARGSRLWTNLPVLARVFLVAALVDLVARVLGVLGLPPPMDLASPLSILGYLPHLAWVLFPVVLLWRRADAPAETPLIVWGAVALALVELLALPLSSLVPTIDGITTAWTALQLTVVAARVGAYVALAIGLRALTRAAPAPPILGLSNLVLAVIGGSAVLSTVFTVLQPTPDLGDPSWTSQVALVNALGSLPTLALAYLARVIVRGTIDLRRPVVATYVATGSVLLTAALHVATLGLGLLALLQLGFALSAWTVNPALGSTFALLGVTANVLLVVAFGLGLGDASGRIPGRGGVQPQPSPEESRA